MSFFRATLLPNQESVTFDYLEKSAANVEVTGKKLG